MTLRAFLMWYLGAVVFVGAAGASGYQVLSRQHSQGVTEASTAPPSTATTSTAPPSTATTSTASLTTPEVPAPPVATAAAPEARSPQPSASASHQHAVAATERVSHAGKGVTEPSGAQQRLAHLRSMPSLASAERRGSDYRPAAHQASDHLGAWYPPPPPPPPPATYRYHGNYAYQSGASQSGANQPGNAYPSTAAHRPGYAYQAGYPYQPGYAYPGTYVYQPGYAYRSAYAYYPAAPRYPYYQVP
jgi:hypothetical protein